MLIQFDLDDLYTEALDHVAKSNGMSRRGYIAEYVVKSLDSVPGLMEMIKSRRIEGLEMKPGMEVAKYRSALLAEDTPERLKRYRFVSFEEQAYEGVGATVGAAFENAYGRRMGGEEYAQGFRAPEFLGYVEQD